MFYVSVAKPTPANQLSEEETKNGSVDVRQSAVASTEPSRMSDKVLLHSLKKLL